MSESVQIGEIDGLPLYGPPELLGRVSVQRRADGTPVIYIGRSYCPASFTVSVSARALYPDVP